ncbi:MULTISPECIES: phenylalanine--tRNA ligase subunit beta [unclassified Brevundimonas]|uniref:phenylalanine--tRNA ligase subunit beta n=1 Tax=unclassified Brevundimonas TaxID=2622653 RepID=UPI0006F6596A|nr:MULTISPECIES: phenylalanine--tRNA ligase subunit beta [unclassified Brevundimonas]KQY88098.1 phenylalanine--tRNA ligase subunit beta [Brevundimonas sp. Root1423]KRA28602.1 phenylalanine--tRNA ligase subunit beta [Brevundimonas sp. Root608]
MKFTLSWLKEHLDTDAEAAAVADAMTMAGLEVEDVHDPIAALAPFTVARIVSAERHPNADRLQVCQVDTVDGRKEIVCGAPNARAGLTTIYAPIGAYVPGLDVTLVEKPVRGVVSHGMLCSAAELQLAGESDGILDLPDDLTVGTPAAGVFGAEPVIDFEVTPNRPDWLGVAGVARDLAAAGLGQLTTPSVEPVAGAFASPITVRIEAPEMCAAFAGRLIRGVSNGPSPDWLQHRLIAIGLRPINRLVDVTNLVAYDRCRPLHVYDAAKLVGTEIVVRGGQIASATPGHEGGQPEHLIALDGKTYAVDPSICVISDAAGERPIGLGGVMGGESTGCSDETVDVFLESAWFDPLVTAQTGRALGISSDAQYRFARGVDPAFMAPGLELATRLILDLCGGEPSEVVLAGQALADPAPFAFDPARVGQLTGLSLDDDRIAEILTRLGFEVARGAPWTVTPPSWRRDVEGPADLVEEVARIEGYAALPSTPLPDQGAPSRGVLNPRQARVRRARRALAAMGYAEAVTWSFTRQSTAALFGGGDERLLVENPIAVDLDCMRPSVLPNLIQAAARNAARGHADAALFEIGPIYLDDSPTGQRTVVAGLIAPRSARHWGGAAEDALFGLKGDLMALLEELGAPVGSLQLVQGQNRDWWHPGRSARLQLGPKTVMVEFGSLHPRVLRALDADGPMLGFEIVLDAVPEPRGAKSKARGAANLANLMPLTRDFAFVVEDGKAVGDLTRAVAGADKALIADVRVFDVYRGAGVAEGMKSVALEVVIQPVEATLTEAEIETLSAKIVAAAGKLGAALRG